MVALREKAAVVWCTVVHWFWHERIETREVMIWRFAQPEVKQETDWQCARCRRRWTEDPIS